MASRHASHHLMSAGVRVTDGKVASKAGGEMMVLAR
jgi:hypothetical protein